MSWRGSGERGYLPMAAMIRAWGASLPGGRWRAALCALLIVGSSGRVQGAERPSVVRVWSGYGYGLDANAHVRKAEAGVGGELRPWSALSVGTELALVHFVGERNTRDVDAVGVTVWPLLRWHFLRSRAFESDFVFGLGGAFFAHPFPPGGTRLNGYSGFGLGARAHVTGPVWITGDVRLVHHSNGRGLVPDNPAYDGLAFTLGVGIVGGR